MKMGKMWHFWDTVHGVLNIENFLVIRLVKINVKLYGIFLN